MALVSALNLIRAAAVVALTACGALLVDYTGTDPAYCTVGTGCAAVRSSGWGYIPLGESYVAVPVFGAVAFALLLAVTLLPSEPWRRRLSLAGGLFAALVGLALIVVQQVILGVFCSLCVIVDLAAIAAGVGAVLLFKPRRASEPLKLWAWALLGAFGFGATFAWPKVRPLPEVPAEVKKLYQPGKINVVEFADFQCPFCRLLHGTLKTLNHEYAGRVNFVRMNMPLAAHSHARDAARAFVCADQQGKGEAYGDLLFEREMFEREQQRAAARELGLDGKRFDNCLSDPATDQRIDREAKILRDAGFEGLPTTFVGPQKIVGALPEDYFRAAYERAAHGMGGGGVAWYIYLVIALGAAGGIVWFGRRAHTPEA